MPNHEQIRARLEADRTEVETVMARFNQQRRSTGSLLPVEEAMYLWLRQRSADLTVQLEEMRRGSEEPPLSPAAYRRWINHRQLDQGATS